MKSLYLSLAFLFAITTTQAQDSTFESVYTMLTTSCANDYCHGSGSANPLQLGGTMENVYNSLINADPSNPAAAAAGYKLVKPGEPTESFLYRKVNGELYHSDMLTSAEGQSMPPSGELTDVQKETIRQWIIWGAPMEGMVHDQDVLDQYYNGNGLDRVEPLEPPAEGEGFQFNVGTIFLEPGEEIEIMKAVEVPLGDDHEIVGFEIVMNEDSHHYALARILNGYEEEIAPGFTLVDNFIIAANFFGNSELITSSQLPASIYNLPENVAYRWDGSNWITINYHIKNYSNTGILPAEGYLNLYVQPRNTAEKAMKTETVTYDVTALNIEPTGTDTTLVMEHFIEGSEEVIDIWQLIPHTHALGKDFDIYKRNPDGTKGEQVYEGFYNYDLGFDQGYYDFSHATYKSFEDPLQIKMSEGLIFEAVFNNPGTETVSFGLTTDDEMFIGYYLYSEGSLENPIANDNIDFIEAELYPNPANDQITIRSNELPNAEVQIFDVMGQLVYQSHILEGAKAINLNIAEFDAGSYIVQILDQNKLYLNQKFVKE